MFCPSCKAEFPQGITRCGHCNIELVDALSKGLSSDAPSEGNLVLLWSGDDLALHGSLLEELKADGVPYFNRAIGNYSLRAFPNRFPASGAPPFGFEVSVLSSDSERAKAILERVARLS
jgi:predicted amidophosphoribosyltransferase